MSDSEEWIWCLNVKWKYIEIKVTVIKILHPKCSLIITVMNFLVFPDCKLTASGMGYRGSHATTNTGSSCIPWADVGHDSVEGNFCRNLNDDPQGPWCYYGLGEDDWEYCDVPNCKGGFLQQDECFYNRVCVLYIYSYVQTKSFKWAKVSKRTEWTEWNYLCVPIKQSNSSALQFVVNKTWYNNFNFCSIVNYHKLG